MNKLLVTVFVFSTVSGLIQAQEQTDLLFATTTKIVAKDQESAAVKIPLKLSEPNNQKNNNETIIPIKASNKLAQNSDYYRVNKGQKGLFFIIQDFYSTGEKRTDPYLVSDLEQVKNNNFDILHYDHLKINGLLITWFKNGQVEQKGIFDQGRRKGLWVSWYDTGQKRSLGHYKDGLKEGAWTVWYQNGKRMQKGYYQCDRREGVWIYWYGNGKKKEAGRYSDDQRVEFWSYWNDSGRLVKNELEEPKTTE